MWGLQVPRCWMIPELEMKPGSEISGRSCQDASTQVRPEGSVKRGSEGCLEDQTALENTFHRAFHLKPVNPLSAKELQGKAQVVCAKK